MSREKELVKNTVVLSLGRFLPKLTTFITLPILTACLTKAEFGTYDLVSTLVMLVLPVATLQIQSAAFRFLIDCRGDRDRSAAIISNIFAVTIPVTILASFLMQFFFAGFDVATRALITSYFFLDTVHLTVGQVTRGIGYNKYYSIASILLSLAYTAGVVVGVYLMGGGMRGLLAALSFAQLAGTLYLAHKIDLASYLSGQRLSLREIRAMLAYSWPMVPNNLSSWVLKLSDRLVITGFLGVEANAVYAAANKIPNILSIAQSIMVMAWQENASIAAGDQDAEAYYSDMLDHVFCLMFGCTALLIAGTPFLFRLLIRGDYEDAYYQMPVLILAMFFFVMSAYFGGIYIAHKKTVNVGISTMAAAAINLAIDLAFVRAIGIWAGSISTLSAYCILYLYRMWNCQRFQPVRVRIGKQAGLVAVLAAMMAVSFQRRMGFYALNAAIGILSFWLANRALVKKALSGAAARMRARHGR